MDLIQTENKLKLVCMEGKQQFREQKCSYLFIFLKSSQCGSLWLNTKSLCQMSWGASWMFFQLVLPQKFYDLSCPKRVTHFKTGSVLGRGVHWYWPFNSPNHHKKSTWRSKRSVETMRFAYELRDSCTTPWRTAHAVRQCCWWSLQRADGNVLTLQIIGTMTNASTAISP